ncbi:MAG TPA: hypothetical protein VF168_12350 [Trueperaceae bacterium]
MKKAWVIAVLTLASLAIAQTPGEELASIMSETLDVREIECPQNPPSHQAWVCGRALPEFPYFQPWWDLVLDQHESSFFKIVTAWETDGAGTWFKRYTLHGKSFDVTYVDHMVVIYVEK